MSNFNVKNYFHILCFDKFGKIRWAEFIKNLTVAEGLNDILDVAFSGGEQKTIWYVGLKATNETPVDAWTAANIGTNFTEFTGYSESVRQTWVEAGVSGKQITNVASPATFNINTTGTIYGSFLVSSNVKSGTSGVLWCCTNFLAARPTVSGDIIKVIYSINASDM